MTRIVQPEGTRGSLNWIQRAVNEHWPGLEAPICEALGTQSIEWHSPLRQDDYAEYRDGEFLEIVGLCRLRPELEKFWPSRGPQWDALGIAGGGEIILVEAKGHVGEMCSSPTQASQASKELIASSLASCATRLRARTGHADWSEHFYQLANRLAHLQFLLDHDVPARLVHVNFLNDHEMAGLGTREVWEAAYQIAFHVLGLGRRHALARYVLHVYPDVTQPGYHRPSDGISPET